MRPHHLLFASALIIPASVLALEYTDATSRYSDAPFSRPEAAGISLLTSIGAVSGNPDGTFAPERSLNRAEFVKIALKSSDKILVTNADAANCFPDVSKTDWFSQFVCLSQKRDIVKGYEDGLFHPERPVTYAEALKILAEVWYGETTPWMQTCLRADPIGSCLQWEQKEVPAGKPWYTLYVDWAKTKGLLLPVNIGYDAPLTRGLMARLAASFVAEHDGTLSEYRKAELGQRTVSSSSRSSSSSVSSSSVSFVSSVSLASSKPSSSSSSSVDGLYPAVSHFLTAHTVTLPIIDGVFQTAEEDVYIRAVNVRFLQEVKSFSGLILVDPVGKEIGRVKVSSNDVNRLNWYGEIASGTYKIPKNTPTRLGLRASLKPEGQGAISAELVQSADFSIDTQGVASVQFRQLVATDAHYPIHQTVLSKLTLVRNASWPTGTLQAGLKKAVGSFSFSGTLLPSSNLSLDEVTFRVQSAGVKLTNWMIGGQSEIEQSSCGVDSIDPGLIVCSAIPENMRTIGASPRTLSLMADVAVLSGSVVPSIQVQIPSPGSVGKAGSIRWTDGSARYSWIEGTTPVATGTAWTVTK